MQVDHNLMEQHLRNCRHHHLPTYQNTEKLIFEILGDNNSFPEVRDSTNRSENAKETDELPSALGKQMENNEEPKFEDNEKNREKTSDIVFEVPVVSESKEVNVPEIRNMFPLAKKDLVLWVGGQMDAVSSALETSSLMLDKWQILTHLQSTLKSVVNALADPNCPENTICKLPIHSSKVSLFQKLFQKCASLFGRSRSHHNRKRTHIGDDVVDKYQEFNCPIQNVIESLQKLLSLEPDFREDGIGWKIFCVPLLIGAAATIYYIGQTNTAETIYQTVAQIQTASDEFDLSLWTHVIIPTVLTAIEALTQSNTENKQDLVQPLLWHWLQYFLGYTAFSLYHFLRDTLFSPLSTKKQD